MLTAGLTFGMLTGCGGEEKKTYDQACADLAQGSYDYALQGYQSSITAGYKTAEAYRGAGIANIHLGNYQDAIDSLTNGLNDEKAGKATALAFLADYLQIPQEATVAFGNAENGACGENARRSFVPRQFRRSVYFRSP